jgi:hypothetical protein
MKNNRILAHLHLLKPASAFSVASTGSRNFFRFMITALAPRSLPAGGAEPGGNNRIASRARRRQPSALRGRTCLYTRLHCSMSTFPLTPRGPGVGRSKAGAASSAPTRTSFNPAGLIAAPTETGILAPFEFAFLLRFGATPPPLFSSSCDCFSLWSCCELQGMEGPRLESTQYAASDQEDFETRLLRSSERRLALSIYEYRAQRLVWKEGMNRLL